MFLMSLPRVDTLSLLYDTTLDYRWYLKLPIFFTVPRPFRLKLDLKQIHVCGFTTTKK